MIRAEHWPFFSSLFSWYTRGAIARSFHALWVRGNCQPGPAPTLVAVQHVSWWDPMLLIYLNHYHWPKAKPFVMMDEHNLKRYAFFRYLGAFGVDLSTPSSRVGAVKYTLSQAKTEGNRIVVFPQGKQRPMDARPIECMDGAGFVAVRKGLKVTPIALRYEYCEDQWPDAFVSHGEARVIHDESEIAVMLTEEADKLRDDVYARRLSSFKRAIRGRGERDLVSTG